MEYLLKTPFNYNDKLPTFFLNIVIFLPLYETYTILNIWKYNLVKQVNK